MVTYTSLSDPHVASLLRAGKVAVIPTDTVYGIVCRAADQAAVARLYALKSRDHNPGPVIAANVEQLVELGLKRRYVSAVAHLWPAALSIEIPHSLSYLNQDTGRSAFRVVADEAVAKLLEQTGPLLTSSANQPGLPPANNLAEAIAYFGDRVDFYVDGGDTSGRPPSTLIRVVDDTIEVVRQGSVKINEYGRIEK